MNTINTSINNEKPTLVVAEDDPTFGMLLKFRLEEDNFTVFVAKDGMEAVDLITEKKPDLIVCDIMMPFLSGLEIVERVRNTMNKNTPFIIISNAEQEEMTLKAFELGANDFLSKPFSINELLARINHLL